MTETLTVPQIPRSLADTGLSASMVEGLILKLLQNRKEMIGLELARQIGLPYGLTEEFLELLKKQRWAHIVRSSDMGHLSAVYSLTESGELVARQRLEVNQYAGKAPVPAAQYEAWVMHQQRKRGWLTEEMIKNGLSQLVMPPKLTDRLGPALNSAKSLLLYGHPGNGKTFLAESLLALMSDSIFVPYAVESHGHIIQLFDPHFHKPVASAGNNGTFTQVPEHDDRWCRIQRPMVVSGGELTTDALDLGFSENLKYYSAPLQMKANNGIYLIDDLGRQRATPQQVLNRWIVPMEQGVDYLTFRDGSKLRVPFDAFLLFSTNLKPGDISDEAFLRRIQYKICLGDPGKVEYLEIFRRSCESMKLAFDPEVIGEFMARRYTPGGQPMRRCHPRDILLHAVNLIEFRNLPVALSSEVLEEAFESCFLGEELA